MIATFSIALAALAQPAQDCRDPQTQTEMNICAGIAYQRADAALNAEYRRAVAEARAQDRDGAPARNAGDRRPGAEATLREAQRAWVSFRDAHCRLMGYEARGGTMESMLVGQCLAELTRARTVQLRPEPLGR